MSDPLGSPAAVRLQPTVAAIRAAEAAWQRGTLRETVEDPELASALGPDLVAAYLSLHASELKPSDFRTSLVDDRLARAEGAVRSPTRRFVATAIVEAGQDAPEQPDLVTDHPPNLRVAMPDGTVDVRRDQIASARFWGVGFAVEAPAATAVENYVFGRALSHLVKDLRAVPKIEHRMPAGAHPLEPGDDQGPRFEQLMLDLLNEHECRARHAPLIEDFLEKTDLRVRVPDYDRKRGARVQVTLTTSSIRHAEKLSKIRRATEFVILSPRTLAWGLERTGARRLLTEDDEAALWSAAGASPAPPSRTERALAIRALLSGAMERHAEHPLGPVGSVCRPLGKLVRAFVDAEANRTTAELRSRESWEKPDGS